MFQEGYLAFLRVHTKKFAGDGEGGHVTEWQERQIWNSDCLSSQVLKFKFFFKGETGWRRL